MLLIFRLFVVFAFVFFSVGLYGQNEMKDSLSLGERLFQEAEELEEEKQWEAAIERYEAALIYYTNKPNNEETIYRIQRKIAIDHLSSGDLSAAENKFSEALEVLEDMRETKLIDTLNYQNESVGIQTNLGALFLSKGMPSKALYHLELTLPIYTKNEDWDKLKGIYYNIGVAWYYLKDLTKANEFAEQAAFYCEQVNESNTMSCIQEYNLLAAISSGLSNQAAAIVWYDKIIAAIEQEKGIESPELIQFYGNRGGIYLNMKDYTKAEKSLRKTIQLAEKQPDNLGKDGFLYQNLAQALALQNAPADSVTFYYQKSILHQEKQFGQRHPRISQLHNLSAELHFKAQNYEQVLTAIQNALVANSFTFNDTTSTKNPTSDELINFSVGLISLYYKSGAWEGLWEQKPERKIAAAEIRKCLNLAGALLEENVMESGGEVVSGNEFKKDLLRVANGAIIHSYQLYQQYRESKDLERVFTWMERVKAQEILLAHQQAEARELTNVPYEFIQQEKKLSQKIDSLELVLMEASKMKDSSTIIAVKNKVFRVKDKRSLVVSQMEVQYPSYFQLKYQLADITIREVQNCLDDKTFYLELAKIKESEEEQLYFLSISNQTAQILKKTLISNYTKKITTFNQLLRSHNLLRADRRRKFIDLSHELYNQFIKPIEHLLEGKERLVIVGEGVTHYLPFEALLKSNEDKPWHELDFLIKNHEISYHYSGTLFARAQEQQQDFDNELLAFAPVFSEGDSTLASLRAGGLLMADTTFRSVEGDNFTPLPHSEKEVKNIEALFPKTATTNILLNETANEQNLKTALEKNHRFVHIASHSFANIDYPKFSGIACAPSDTTQHTDDGILYVGEVYNLAVNSDLVVLSSCESGVGKLLGGEGMLGLNRSFVYAGVPNVIFSLWKVYDENTGELMTEFYKNTLEGQSYSKALRTAKLKMLANPETAAPDIWAAFLLVGR